MSHSSSCHCSKEIVDYLQVDCKAKIKGDVKIKGDLRVDGKTDLKGDVTVAGDAHFQQPATFDQNVSVTGALAVAGESDFAQNVTFGENVSVLGNLTVQGSILPLRSVTLNTTAAQPAIVSGGSLRTPVQFNNVTQSNGLTFDTVNFQFQAPTTGIYSFSTVVVWDSFADDTARGVGLIVNGLEVNFTSNINLNNSQSPSSTSAILRLNANDIVQVQVAQTSVSNRTLSVIDNYLAIAQLR
jgi:hypothetical protein